MTRVARSSFIVVIHDVADPFTSSVMTILKSLAPLVQRTVAVAVVPCWHGRTSLRYESAFHTYLREQCGEILLHGYTHQCRYLAHPLAMLTGNANEFSGLSRIDAYMRLKMGKMMLARWFDPPIHGFVPPAWQYGRLDRDLLGASGLSYGLRFFHLEPVYGPHLPLATWSWDTGRIAALGLLGELVGQVGQILHPDRLPCIVLHPADIQRGFLTRGLRLVQNLLNAGYCPVLPGDVRKHTASATAYLSS